MEGRNDLFSTNRLRRPRSFVVWRFVAANVVLAPPFTPFVLISLTGSRVLDMFVHQSGSGCLYGHMLI